MKLPHEQDPDATLVTERAEKRPRPGSTIIGKGIGVDYSSDGYTSSPSKRVKTEAINTLAQDEDVEPTPPPQDDFRRSPEFWYPDGNVVVKIENTGFKLLASRLRHHCQYFSTLLPPAPPGAHAQEGRAGAPLISTYVDSTRSDGAFVVTCVTAHQFEVFLKFLDTPFENPIQTAPHDTVIALYHASSALGSPSALALALTRIKTLWDSHAPPDPAHPLPCEYEDALQLVALARAHGVPCVLKRAFYEVLRCARFWALVDSRGHRAVEQPGAEGDLLGLTGGLSQADLLGLYTARVALGNAWRALCARPPRVPRSDTPCACRVREDGAARARAWRAALCDAVLVDLDPLSYAAQLRSEFVLPGGDWCDKCLKKVSKRWKAARVLWWGQLDVWLGLQPQEGEAPS
ncbi:hypothetical protein VTO73DRAFT_12116 [Trametes versicolor]